MAMYPLDLLYVGTLPPHQGGSAISMAQILQGLVERGHRVRSVAPITEQALNDGDWFAERHPDLGIRRMVMPFHDHSPDVPKAADYRELERAQIEAIGNRLIVERRPDLAIAGRESFVWYVPDVAVPHDIPIVAFAHGSTTHGMVDGTYTKALTEGLIERFRQADLVVTPAQHMAKSLGRLGLAGVKVVRNPVDLNLFQPSGRNQDLARVLRIGADDIVVAHFSNMIPVKQTLDIVTAAALALVKEPRLLFLIVGDGPLRAKAEEACAQARIAQRFRFVTWVDHADVPRYLSLADIVVQPSAAEGQALIYLEAQATGRTLVASDIPAAREVIVDGRTGLLFSSGNTDEFARTIIRAAVDPVLRAAIAGAAGARVLSHALGQVVDEHERLLASVAARARHRRASRGRGITA
jgi:glycosyltransferase involved in cell wall biosynthesis